MTKQKLFLAFVAVVASGCATVRMPDGTTTRYFMPQVGVVVRVVNNCAPLMDFERVGGVVVKGLPFGGSATVPLVSTAFSGSSRRMPLIAKGYTGENVYLGSLTREFHVNTSQGSREEFWEVNRLNLPGRLGGCQG